MKIDKVDAQWSGRRLLSSVGKGDVTAKFHRERIDIEAAFIGNEIRIVSSGSVLERALDLNPDLHRKRRSAQ